MVEFESNALQTGCTGDVPLFRGIILQFVSSGAHVYFSLLSVCLLSPRQQSMLNVLNISYHVIKYYP